MKGLIALFLILSILGLALCGEHETNRFLDQESHSSAEYQAKIKQIVDKSKSDKMLGVKTNDDDIIHIHMVPHSHDDVGFKKTLDEYYTGSADMIIRAGVQYVLGKIFCLIIKNLQIFE